MSNVIKSFFFDLTYSMVNIRPTQKRKCHHVSQKENSNQSKKLYGEQMNGRNSIFRCQKKLKYLNWLNSGEWLISVNWTLISTEFSVNDYPFVFLIFYANNELNDDKNL